MVGLLALSIAWVGFEGIARPNVYTRASLLAIIIAFLSHELAHKYVAIMYGFRARYRVSPLWLAVTILSSFTQIKILAPGYVEVSYGSMLRIRGIKWTIAWGPLANILLALVAYIAYLLLPQGFTKNLLVTLAEVNAYIAVFNLIPINPLDGGKLIRISRLTWAVLMAVAVGLLATIRILV